MQKSREKLIIVNFDVKLFSFRRFDQNHSGTISKLHGAPGDGTAGCHS